MKKITPILFLLAGMILGILSSIATIELFIPGNNYPLTGYSYMNIPDDEILDDTPKDSLLTTLGIENQERPSPQDRIDESNIHVYDDKVVIDIDNPEWARFADTNSMDPIIDEESNAIEIIPEYPEDLQVGDIISYSSEYSTGTIIHRISSIGSDDNGWFCTAKGDNNPVTDPGKIRFSQIKRVVVAIIY